MHRRQILLSAAALASIGPLAGLPAGKALASPLEVVENDRVLGVADAPVTILEYSSLTCPYCANFHRNTLPQVKEQWIDSGRARLVYRHFPLDALALRAAMVTNCMGTDRAFFGLLEMLFQQQAQWSRAQDPLAALAGIARQTGMSEERFDSCIQDEAEMDRILNVMLEAREVFDISSTPSFIVNGRKVQGALPYEEFERSLDEAYSQS